MTKPAIITQSRGTFSMRCGVALNIGAPAATIWSLPDVPIELQTRPQ